MRRSFVCGGRRVAAGGVAGPLLAELLKDCSAGRRHPPRRRWTYFVFLRKILCFLREGWRFPKNPCFGPPQRFRAVAGLFVTWNPTNVRYSWSRMLFLCTFGAHVMFGLGFRYKGAVTACNASRRQSSPCHSKLMEETAAVDRGVSGCL